MIFLQIIQKQHPKKLRRKVQRSVKSHITTPTAKQIAKPRRGRVKKAKPKKALKINGLDLLHSQTLLSTSPQGMYFISFYECCILLKEFVLQMECIFSRI